MCWKDSCLGVLGLRQTEGVRPLPQVSKSLFTGQTQSLLNKAQVSAPVWLFEYKNLACYGSENLLSEIGFKHLEKKRLLSVWTWLTGRQQKQCTQWHVGVYRRGRLLLSEVVLLPFCSLLCSSESHKVVTLNTRLISVPFFCNLSTQLWAGHLHTEKFYFRENLVISVQVCQLCRDEKFAPLDCEAKEGRGEQKESQGAD